jgi:seryl-tRNA synthetase (EC 6.1.1.11)
MLDIKVIRNNPEKVKKAMRDRNKDIDIDAVIALDNERRDLIQATDKLKAEQNAESKRIPVLRKENKNDEAAQVLQRMKELSEQIKQNDAKIHEVEEKLRNMLLAIPNIPHESCPIGRDDKDNVEVRRYSEPRKFDFEPKPHWELGEALGILDPETAAKVTGARFHFYKGLGARLERSVYTFYLNFHTEVNGYTEIFPPYMVNRASMIGTGQLPKV